MGFKESYMEDLQTTIFDQEELAGGHTIDGVTINVIVQEMTLESAFSRNRRNAVNPKEAALNAANRMIYVLESDLSKLNRSKFTANSIISFDGEKLFVQSVKKMNGMYRLKVGRMQM